MTIPTHLSRAILTIGIAAITALPLGAQQMAEATVRSPVRATVLSVVLPGAGQMYAGRSIKGLQILGATVVTGGAALAFAMDTNVCALGVDCAPPSPAPAVLLGSAAALIWIYGIATAGDDARAANEGALAVSVAPTFASRRPALQLRGVFRW